VEVLGISHHEMHMRMEAGQNLVESGTITPSSNLFNLNPNLDRS
jgi:hypothetical protein